MVAYRVHITSDYQLPQGLHNIEIEQLGKPMTCVKRHIISQKHSPNSVLNDANSLKWDFVILKNCIRD